MRTVISGLGVVALVLAAAGPVGALCTDSQTFLTGGGFIFPTGGSAKVNFGVGGSCNKGGDNHVLWGHLEYVDNSITVPGTTEPVNVHWTSITAYFFDPADPTEARFICGTGRTNLAPDQEVDWVVRAKDGDGPGGSDEFDITVVTGGGACLFTTFGTGFPHTLGGGNIELHNKPTSGSLGGTCPASLVDITKCDGID